MRKKLFKLSYFFIATLLILSKSQLTYASNGNPIITHAEVIDKVDGIVNEITLHISDSIYYESSQTPSPAGFTLYSGKDSTEIIRITSITANSYDKKFSLKTEREILPEEKLELSYDATLASPFAIKNSKGLSLESFSKKPITNHIKESIKSLYKSELTNPEVIIEMKIDSPNVTISNNKEKITRTMDAHPIIYMNRTLLPARNIAELFNIDVDFRTETKKRKVYYSFGGDGYKPSIKEYVTKHITFKKGDNTIQLDNSMLMRINTQKVLMSSQSISIDGTVYLPIKDINYAFIGLGIKTDTKWDPSSKTITIYKS